MGALAASGLLDAAPAPADLLGPDAMLVLQDSSDPDVGRDLVLRHADDPAAQVLGRGDAPVGAHVDARLAEHARDERRYGDIVVVARAVVIMWLLIEISVTSNSR